MTIASKPINVIMKNFWDSVFRTNYEPIDMFRQMLDNIDEYVPETIIPECRIHELENTEHRYIILQQNFLMSKANFYAFVENFNESTAHTGDKNGRGAGARVTALKGTTDHQINVVSIDENGTLDCGRVSTTLVNGCWQAPLIDSSYSTGFELGDFPDIISQFIKNHKAPNTAFFIYCVNQTPKHSKTNIISKLLKEYDLAIEKDSLRIYDGFKSSPEMTKFQQFSVKPMQIPLIAEIEQKLIKKRDEILPDLLRDYNGKVDNATALPEVLVYEAEDSEDEGSVFSIYGSHYLSIKSSYKPNTYRAPYRVKFYWSFLNNFANDERKTLREDDAYYAQFQTIIAYALNAYWQSVNKQPLDITTNKYWQDIANRMFQEFNSKNNKNKGTMPDSTQTNTEINREDNGKTNPSKPMRCPHCENLPKPKIEVKEKKIRRIVYLVYKCLNCGYEDKEWKRKKPEGHNTTPLKIVFTNGTKFYNYVGEEKTLQFGRESRMLKRFKTQREQETAIKSVILRVVEYICRYESIDTGTFWEGLTREFEKYEKVWITDANFGLEPLIQTQ